MSQLQEATETLHYSVGILATCAGALLLAVDRYSTAPLIHNTALGILLLIVAVLVGYTGIRKNASHAVLFVNLCLTVSALWCGTGLIRILIGEKVIQDNGIRNALVPGYSAFTLGLFIIGVIGLIQKEIILAMIAFAISLATAHEIAALYDQSFGHSAIALSYLIVFFIGLYFGLGRVSVSLSKGKIIFPGTCLHKIDTYLKPETIKNDVVVLGYITNMLSASVLGCQVLGVTTNLFVGQVPWLWTAAVYQIVGSVLSYRAIDSLTATFFGLTSILKFAEGYAFLYKLWQDNQLFFPVPAPTVLAVLFFILALFMASKSLADGIYVLFFVSYCISVAAHPTGFFHGGAQGVSVAIFVASACLAFISLFNSIGSITIPTGKGIIKGFLIRMNALTPKSDNDTHNPYLGYSKYSDAEILAHACNVVAAFAITISVNTSTPLATVVLPWIIIPGGLLQLICGSISFSRGKTLESCAFILYGLIWIIWGLTRYGGLYGSTRGFGIAVGIICFLLFNGFVVIGTLFLNAAWFAFSLSFQLILISFLLDAINSNPFGYDIGVTIIFGLVSFYCFLATLFNQSFERPQLPLGRAWASLCGFGHSNSICPHLSSRKTSSVRKIAEIMKNGGTCGIPTDTVYVLVAACNRPDAVEKAYNTKKQAKERPMSLWISNVAQLEPAKHLLSPLLWDLMQKVWPSSISLVIPRGEWLNLFGLQHAEKYIGTPQSIAIRIPDCTVTTHLIDQVGPIAVTSANPTGEADTTHHNQVYAKLGNKVDAVLCDGPSPENIASTVVDCTKIETGTLGFFRVGLVPKSQVLQLFEEVRKKHLKGQSNNGFNEDETECSTHQHPKVTNAYDNTNFIKDDEES
ncbi:uncharacterized protein si:ch211-153b23.4 [Chiloscyllium plagiosum]|uniref:uncharacterized protein si:ch211-153b23.4 n=1 Tax=Chiloscyllium plagiosum TaxID=36176 RepID=UPI001CB8349D|nr:uncharacterized protein si:ch211-153b23.4 [Chiloscyllium plagiosum]XP_043560596.1 uncharacterized protein si:ch211-153b23.4 [Chiloscyllium plagiosum]XP_043560597.1 uncharacterized protein si:ch211-153b23.4 [Chiloscyllium plagiosum]